MGNLTAELFDKLIEDAEARPHPDRPGAKRNSTATWNNDEVNGKGPIQRNDEFKDKVYELLMHRAKEHFESTCQGQKTDPKTRYAIATVTVVISEKVIHPNGSEISVNSIIDKNDPVLKELHYDFSVAPAEFDSRAKILHHKFDSSEMTERIQSLNDYLALGCGPNNI